MYQSHAKGKTAETVEEVLPAAIEATATSPETSPETMRVRDRGKGRKESWGERRRQLTRSTRGGNEEPGMVLMKAGSPLVRLPALPGGLAVAALVLFVLVVTVFVLI